MYRGWQRIRRVCLRTRVHCARIKYNELLWYNVSMSGYKIFLTFGLTVIESWIYGACLCIELLLVPAQHYHSSDNNLSQTNQVEHSNMHAACIYSDAATVLTLWTYTSGLLISPLSEVSVCFIYCMCVQVRFRPKDYWSQVWHVQGRTFHAIDAWNIVFVACWAMMNFMLMLTSRKTNPIDLKK